MYTYKIHGSITPAIENYVKSGSNHGVISVDSDNYDDETINNTNKLLLYADGIVTIKSLSINYSNNVYLKDINNIKYLSIDSSNELYITNSRIEHIIINNSRVTIVGCVLSYIHVFNSSIFNIVNCTIEIPKVKTIYNYVHVMSNSILNISICNIISLPEHKEDSLFNIYESNLNIADSNILCNNNNSIFYLHDSSLLANRLDISGNNISNLAKLYKQSTAEFYDLLLDHELDVDAYDNSSYTIFAKYIRSDDVLEIDKLDIKSISTNIKYIIKDYTIKPDDHTLIVEAPVNINLNTDLAPGTAIVIVNNSPGDIKLIGNIDNIINLILPPDKSLTLRYSGDKSNTFNIVKLDYLEPNKCLS